MASSLAIIVALFCCCLAINVAAAGVFKMPMRKHHKSVVDRSDRSREMLLNSGDSKSKGPFKQKLRDYHDYDWLVTMTVGTPGQEFNVFLDTGSPDFWLFNKDFHAWDTHISVECLHPSLCHDLEQCDADCSVNNEKKAFDSERSSTFNKTSRQLNCLYGRGWAQGSWALDTVKFGSKDEQKALVVPSASVGLAERFDGNTFGDAEINGMLGLDYSEDDHGMVGPLRQAVQDGLLDKHMFTVYLHTNASSDGEGVGGVVTWGGMDTENCQNVIGWANIKRNNETWWNFEIESIAFGGDNNNSSSSKQLNDAPVFGISDSGCTLIQAHEAIFAPIKEKLQQSAGVEINSRGEIPCDADYPPMVLRIGGRNYTLGKEFLTVPNKDDTTKCAFGIALFDGTPDLILGDPFIRKYCQVYDFEHSRVGFAEKKPQAK